jgi:phosphoesterase RecJ-like protein
MWLQIKEALEKHQDFIITTHIHPDGDGIGSATALIELLRKLGKRCRFVCDGPIPEKFRFLDYYHSFEEYQDSPYKADALIILDTSQPNRIGRLEKLLRRNDLVTICIDHHPFEESFATLEHIDPTACATGALIYTLFQYYNVRMNVAAATGIYVSILCDTSRFSNSCSDRVAHTIANECIQLGVDPDRIHSRIFQHVPLQEMKIFAAALQRMETYFDNKVVVQEIRQEDFPNQHSQELEFLDLDYILEFNKSIQEVECVVLLRELPGEQVRVSLRSKPDFDIRPVVKRLGGGGHKNAAGANISGTISEVKGMVISLLEKSMTSKIL